MKAWVNLLLMVSALLLSACEAVVTGQPMGAEIVKLDTATWQGTWLGDEVVMVTTVLDSDQGLMQAAWVERGADGARFETVTGTVRKSGDWLFLSMEHQQFEDDQDATADAADAAETVEAGEQAVTEPALPEYFWARVENSGQRTLLWWPNVEQIRFAIREKRLPGTIREDDNLVLGPLDDAQMDLINSPNGNLLNWAEPVVFIRIGD